MATDQAVRGRTRATVVVGYRVAGAALTVAMGWIHLYLWANGYSDTPTIGVLFLLNGIGAALLAVALLSAPDRLLGVVAGLGAAFTVATLAALIGSLTSGVFGFQEYLADPYVDVSLALESVGVLGLVTLTIATLGRHR